MMKVAQIRAGDGTFQKCIQIFQKGLLLIQTANVILVQKLSEKSTGQISLMKLSM